MKGIIGAVVFCVTMLVAMGLLALYSATFSKLEKNRSSSSSQVAVQQSGSVNSPLEAWQVKPRHVQGMNVFKQQAQFVGLGVVLCLCIALFFNYRWLQKGWLSFALLFVCAVLLSMVFFPALGGVKVNGSCRWLNLHLGFKIQPSELAKLSIVIFLSWYGAQFPALIPRFWKGLILPFAIISPLIGLILIETDLGTTAFLLVLSCAMVLIMGARWQYLLIPGAVAMVAVIAKLCTDPVRLGRLLSWRDIEGTKYDVGLQAYSSLVALGSGGIFGRGLGESEQKMGFIPEDHTDFILPVIGEEMGLVATLLIVLLFAGLLFCGVRVALKTKDRFGIYLALGITLMIALQSLINIGVVTSVLPNKGMPLPFISKGGSNILMLMMAVGLLLSIGLRGGTEKESDSGELKGLEDEDENLFAERQSPK